MNRDTIFSPCRLYRYTLYRIWNELEPKPRIVQFIGLNPSKADEVRNDNTVSRCIQFAKNWGYDGICMTNLFAFRATDPSDMKAQPEPAGPENRNHLIKVARDSALHVACWGDHGLYQMQAAIISTTFREAGFILHCLGKTKGGHPRHPSRLGYNTELIPL
jgi:hypothetical protein